ncbi:MAG: patatin-like phospholipase family protein [Gemmatimonadota bacterium]|nr:patatin-like phospholipase family protein [Gemmatimonadota bacterium]MDH3476756.1 patatin-like phospholipase family protein [Gemmatimonadota bacterium]MDH3570285.1 patatin-like phospholipase family protein [Gemmatimonadota bacterium]MDH5551353.1 patatin-like phospholipase family protein [Gemmatimonadota bacterium]
MPDAVTNGRPLALVLSGGGARAAYQVGAVNAIAERFPNLSLPILCGVSAGAINSVYLSAHQGTLGQAAADLRREWGRLTPDRVFAIRPVHLGRAVARWFFNMLLARERPHSSLQGLMDMSPLRGFLAACMDVSGIQQNIDAGRLRAGAVSTTCYSTGQTVTFVQGASDLQLWERHMRVAVRTQITAQHLSASAAIPIIFPAIRIGQAYYGDGSVRLTAPLAPAIHLGAHKILAVAMRAIPPSPGCDTGSESYPVAAEVFGLLLHSIFLDSLDADAERLERMNALLDALPPGTTPPGGMRRIDLMLLRPSRDLGQMARGHTLDLPRMVQFVVASMGGGQARSPDLLSYLMFEPGYTGALIELGYDDTVRRMDEIEAFLEHP